jgi:transcriptional regulator with XRE-family HTH domain
MLDPDKLRTRGQKLAAARQAKGLTQQQAAQVAGVDVASISRIERGEVEPSLDRLKALCDLYGVTVDSILAD